MTRNGIETLIRRVEKFINTPIEDLIQNINNNKSGVLQFPELINSFNDFKYLLSFISFENIVILPEFKQEELYYKLEPFFDKVDEIQNLLKNQHESDIQQKQRLIDYFNNPIYINDSGRSGFFASQKNDIWNIISQSIAISKLKAEEEARNIVNSLYGIETDAKQKKLQLESILSSAQNELSKAGVEKHSMIFSGQANEHSNNALRWRKYSIGLILAILLVSIFIFIIIVFYLSSVERIILIETSVFGALIISLLSYSLSLCVKNYFAEKHSESINRHKANCLSTFNTFADSADEERKAAVLLQATQTIFSHQRSGFLSKDAEASNPNPLIEVVRSFSSR